MHVVTCDGCQLVLIVDGRRTKSLVETTDGRLVCEDCFCEELAGVEGADREQMYGDER